MTTNEQINVLVESEVFNEALIKLLIRFKKDKVIDILELQNIEYEYLKLLHEIDKGLHKDGC